MTGPVAVEQHQPFHGIADLLADTPPGGSLNIFVAHGMRADSDQDQASLRNGLAQRLHLTPLQQTPNRRRLLDDRYPKVELDHQLIWADMEAWRKDQPYLDIAYYRASGDRQVVFYSLNYWPPLVRLKCVGLVADDSNLVGPSRISAYCRDLGVTVAAQSASTAPLIGNQWLKTEIMTWGFGDAAIVMSQFERVLHAAVREALADEVKDVGSRRAARHGVVAHAAGAEATLAGFRGADDQRFAVVTESLGGFITIDTLASAADSDLSPSSDPVATVSAAEILCRAQQVHMLANQIDLFRFSNLRVGNVASVALVEPCLATRQSTPSRPPIQVVAYHDPNDQLTFYNSQSATSATLGVPTINVVAPFAPVWVPKWAADPISAHTKQDEDCRIMDMVAFGSDGRKPLTGPPDR